MCATAALPFLSYSHSAAPLSHIIIIWLGPWCAVLLNGMAALGDRVNARRRDRVRPDATRRPCRKWAGGPRTPRWAGGKDRLGRAKPHIHPPRSTRSAIAPRRAGPWLPLWAPCPSRAPPCDPPTRDVSRAPRSAQRLSGACGWLRDLPSATWVRASAPARSHSLSALVRLLCPAFCNIYAPPPTGRPGRSTPCPHAGYGGEDRETGPRVLGSIVGPRPGRTGCSCEPSTGVIGDR